MQSPPPLISRCRAALHEAMNNMKKDN
ncbi:hypothetical protein ANCCAN_08990 [Ancylostoma caninum]|uniref:Uncharacterized protein n=1 Tax=Ancylostoma caninum TaxID=29170 RepID=A0A368GPQ3_ANCCA|nr:hypothetical protein ANCCAN_08990 [Ancylostoma caninum]